MGITDSSGETVWHSVADGRRLDPPRGPVPIATAWTEGLMGHDCPPSADVARWTDRLDPFLLRAQAVGDVVLLDQARGKGEVRSLSWGVGEELRRFRDDVHSSIRVETMGEHALLLDPTRQRLEILSPDREDAVAIDLPPPMAEAVALCTETPSYRHLYVLPELDRVVLAMLGSRVFWWSLDAMRTLASAEAPSSVRWTFAPFWSRGDADARVVGTVTVVAANRTFVKAGDKTITLHLTGPSKGDRVVLLGRLWDASGVIQYERIELPDGRVIPLPGTPALPTESTTQTSIVRPTPRDTTRTVKALAKKLREAQAEGILRGVTPEVLGELVDGGVTSMRDLLEAYYADDESRMIEDGFLTHDWRFGQETDDVIAEISARIGGPPMFEQTAKRDDVIEVRDRTGAHHRIEVTSLADVIDFFNVALSRGNDERRLVAFDDEDGDQLSYLLTTPEAAKRLRRLGIPLRA